MYGFSYNGQLAERRISPKKEKYPELLCQFWTPEQHGHKSVPAEENWPFIPSLGNWRLTVSTSLFRVERSLDSTLVRARQVQVLRLDNKQIGSVTIKADLKPVLCQLVSGSGGPKQCGPGSWSQKWNFFMKNIFKVKGNRSKTIPTRVCTKAFLYGRKPILFVNL